MYVCMYLLILFKEFFFLLIAFGLRRAITIQSLELLPRNRDRRQELCNVVRKHILQKNPVVASLLTDRNWSVAVGLGKILAETHPQACVSSRKFGEKTAKLHRLRELPSRGALPLVLYTQKHTQNAKINLSRPSRKGVDRGCGPHYPASG